MSKRLELLFLNETGGSVTIGIDDPIEPVDSFAVAAAMNTIIEQSALSTSGGSLVEKRGARLVERTVEMINIEG
ncbi:hypothetical protein CR194_10500 [Salipaludibacillus keqinensis]|uniref:DUF2922 domain-containing protein n=1 Tax=Salipaludibacillus keqinensis TaxID=2045207 RepID=A0A323TVN0_9BACI|nr:DUF2922 domain-containing protein [Salipaludibacillus keqinensis]PYZ93585.1 hypothetical protein CR194_10500 [Salipaludibacillus keqinensis]